MESTFSKEGPYQLTWNPQISWGERVTSTAKNLYGNALFIKAGEYDAAEAIAQGRGLQQAFVYIITRILLIPYPDTLEVFRALRDFEGGRYQFADRRILLEMMIAYPEVFFNKPPVLGMGNPLIEGKETRYAAAWAGREVLPDLSGYGKEVFSVFAQISSYPFPTGNYRYALVEGSS